MMFELDKVMSLFEEAEKEKVELIKKIQALQGDDQEDEDSEEAEINFQLVGSDQEMDRD